MSSRYALDGEINAADGIVRQNAAVLASEQGANLGLTLGMSQEAANLQTLLSSRPGAAASLPSTQTSLTAALEMGSASASPVGRSTTIADIKSEAKIDVAEGITRAQVKGATRGGSALDHKPA